MKHHNKAKKLVLVSAIVSLLCTSLSGYSKNIDSTGSSMKHLPGTPGGIPLLGSAPLMGKYHEDCQKLKNALDTLKQIATGTIAAGAGVTLRSAYIAKLVSDGKYKSLLAAIPGDRAAKAGVVVMALAASVAATVGGLYGANCKYRLAVFNQSNNTVWCKVDIKSARDSLFNLTPGENVVIAGGIGFPIRQIYCDPNKEIVDKKNLNSQAKFKSSWPGDNCKDEAQFVLTGGEPQTLGCVKP